jgi:hypothetical protein
LLGLCFDVDFDPLVALNVVFADAVAAALGAHPAFAGMARFALPRTAAHRQFTSAVRERLAPSRATGARVAATP